MNNEYKKGDKVQMQGEVEFAWGVGCMGYVYDEETGLSSDDLLVKLEGRKVKITVEFLD